MNEKIEIVEGILSSALDQVVRIHPTLNPGSENSMASTKEFISLLYKDTGFSVSYIVKQVDQQYQYNSLNTRLQTLNVQTVYEENFKVKCSLTESIKMVKQRIEDTQGIDQYYYDLKYNKIILSDDNKRLVDYGIKDNDTLIIELKLKKFYIIVKIHRAITKILECEESDTLNGLINSMRSNLGINNLIIESYYDMDKPLNKLGIKPGTVFSARKAHFSGGVLAIKIPCGETLWVEADKDDTVQNLIESLSKAISDKNFHLMYQGDHLNNSETLDFYEIQDKDTIFLVRNDYIKLSVNVKPLTGTPFVVNNLSLVDTIKNLKAKIHSAINVPIDAQCLIFNNQRLENKKTLDEYKIRDQDTVSLAMNIANVGDIKIDVRTLKGVVASVKANLDCNIEDLKHRIKERFSNIQVNSMAIMYASKLLDDAKTLNDYHIENDTVLHLLVRENQNIYLSAVNLLEPSLDYDFTKINDEGKAYQRGSKPYLRPCGWKRIAIKASKQYEQDDIWLGSSNKPGEWPVGYHGTDFEKVKDIVATKININNLRGLISNRAHLTTHDIRLAEEFAKTIYIKGKIIKFVIQSRIRPDNIIYSDQNRYMILPSYQDMRPYGICYKFL